MKTEAIYHPPTCRAPLIKVPGWRIIEQPGMTTAAGTLNGLRALVSVEAYFSPDDGPLSLPGEYLHVSVSLPDRHPTWEEMRDAVRECPWGTDRREWFMVLPRPEDYVNVHEHTFHWWQRAVH